MSGIGSIIGGVGDLFAAGQYGKAASLARQNAALAKESTALQEYVANKQIYQGMGAERSSYAGSNLKLGGSALDVLRNTAQLGALRKSQISIQGAIEENGYMQQAEGLQAQETSALFGGIGGIAGGMAQNAMAAGG